MRKSQLQGKTVLITGASSGIGEALARQFAAAGARLALTARRMDRLQALETELKKKGSQVISIACDVTIEGDLDRAAKQVVQTFGSIDIVITNAGFGVVGQMADLKVEDYKRQFETNVYGVLRTTYATLNELKKSRGILALIGSVSGYVSLPGSSPYSMSKFAVRALAQALRGELKPYGISVVVLNPGFVESEIRKIDNTGVLREEAKEPIPSWLRVPADKAAREIVRAIACRKRERVITGHGKLVVFVARHFPWLISFAVERGLRGRPQPKT